jgi:hypothetical protein
LLSSRRARRLWRHRDAPAYDFQTPLISPKSTSVRAAC